MRESKIETALKAKVCALGGASFKFTSPGTRGVSDQIVILPNQFDPPDIIFVEVKQKGKKPDDHQQDFRKQLKSLGCCVEVIDSLKSIED